MAIYGPPRNWWRTALDSRRRHRLATSISLLRVLRAAPLIGRGFTAGDDLPEAAGLISHRMWQRRSAPSRGVGRTVVGRPGFTVIGVMPPESDSAGETGGRWAGAGSCTDPTGSGAVTRPTEHRPPGAGDGLPPGREWG